MGKKINTEIRYVLSIFGLSLFLLGATKECENRPESCGSQENLQTEEECDDGDAIEEINSGDGCSWECKIEEGWQCTGTSQSVCTPICGENCGNGLACLETAHCTSGHCISCQDAGLSLVDDPYDTFYGSCEDSEGKRAQMICVECAEDAHCETGFCHPEEHICMGCLQDSDCSAGSFCSDDGQCEETCGDGYHDPESEECDATAAEWDPSLCDENCRRLIYIACDNEGSCPNDLQCQSGICTTICPNGDENECSAIPGYESICATQYSTNFCTILCDEWNNCPSGLQCQLDQGICLGVADNSFCSTDPCVHGTCIEEVNGYFCDCSGTGYTGELCQTNIDDCPDANPCQNGGSCIDDLNSFFCDCNGTGFTGELCQTNIDDCPDVNPCQNGGSCIDDVNGFFCDCNGTGFTGELCQTNIDDCPDVNPCQNGGSCIDDVNEFSCDCTGTGYTGELCEIEIVNEQDAAVPDASSEDAGSGPVDSGIVGTQIIADHTICNRYDDIPTEYINAVKKMWINIPGESHSSGYRIGLQLLSDSEPIYHASITESGAPEAYRENALRISRFVRNQSGWNTGTGESGWYTNTAALDKIKYHIQYCQTNNFQIAAIGFGWCWDMSFNNEPGGEMDPVYKVRWAGASKGGPNGDMRWGLDAEDFALTGNQVSMDTYLDATQQYMDFCANNGYATKVLFTTGPVDGYDGENGYQRQLKQDHIRHYVLTDSSRILFDYADILAWNDAGVENLQTWADGEGNSHPYQMIHPDNMVDLDGSYSEDGDHIGERGAVRLAKAIWWTLARIAGWDGN